MTAINLIFCNKTMGLYLRFWPVKAVHFLINIHKRGRKCLKKALLGLLTDVMIILLYAQLCVVQSTKFAGGSKVLLESGLNFDSIVGHSDS